MNAKTYQSLYGSELGDLLEQIKPRQELVVCPQHVDIHRASTKGFRVFAQSTAWSSNPANTGRNTPEAARQAGATGTIINHSEHQISEDLISGTVRKAGETGLTTVVCAQDVESVEKYSGFSPDYVAYEPPSLISGSEPVSEQNQSEISAAAESCDVPLLVGAGVSTAADVEKSLDLGAEGVLVASAVAEASSPAEKMLELLRPFDT